MTEVPMKMYCFILEKVSIFFCLFVSNHIKVSSILQWENKVITYRIYIYIYIKPMYTYPRYATFIHAIICKFMYVINVCGGC